MTAPRQSTASKPCEAASCLATSGISNAPGTQCTGTLSRSRPSSVSVASAPSTSFSVTWALNRPATTARRMPVASSGPSAPAYSPISVLSVLSDLAHLLEIEEMPELALLRAQIRDVLVVGLDVQWHALHDRKTVAVESAVLGGIVGHEPHRRDAEVDQDLRADAVLARVGEEAELDVGLHGVAPFVLQAVRPHLVAEPDPPTLVAAQVHEHALAFTRDPLEREIELHTAVAAHRAEHVAREALGVHSHQHVGLARDLAAHEREMLDAV